jgi:hypothetical protein
MYPHQIFIVAIHYKSLFAVTASFGTATPVGAPAAIATSPALGSSILALGGWRWADKGIINVKGLFEELVAVKVRDGLAGFGES